MNKGVIKNKRVVMIKEITTEEGSVNRGAPINLEIGSSNSGEYYQV